MLDASNRANNWAAQKREAVDKAKKIREERKYNLAMAGEMSMANQMGGNNLGRITSSENQYRGDFQKPMQNDYLGYRKPATMKYGMSLLDQAPTEDDLMQARSSLRLLKSKMKDSNGFSNQPPQNFGKQRGYFEEETHEYMQHAPGERRLGQDNNFNDVYQNGNNNYRKVFKPNLGDDNYQRQNNNINSQLNQIDQSLARKTKVLQHANTSGPGTDSYQPSMYGGGSQQTRPRVLGMPNDNKKYGGYNNNAYSQPPQNDDYSDFSSQNMPSRIPKNTLNSTKEYGAQQSKLLKNYNNEPVSPMYNDNARGWNDSSPTYDSRQPIKVPNSIGKNNMGGANKNWQKEKNSHFDNHDEPEDTSAFSKPNFKKNTQPPKMQPQKAQPQRAQQKPAASQNDDNRPLGGNGNDPEMYQAEAGPQVECPMGCGRSFNPESIDKHAKICKKVFQQKRKKFDSSNQRATDDQAEVANENRYNNPYPSKNKGKPPMGKPGAGAGAGGKGGKAKWKAESEAFRANLRAARGGTLSKEEQQSIAQASEANLIPCPHCGRKFNDNAAQRHISFCATKSKVNSIKNGPIKGRKY